jgi:large subunit ribosomal protein L20
MRSVRWLASAKKALEYLKNTETPNAFEGAVR